MATDHGLSLKELFELGPKRIEAIFKQCTAEVPSLELKSAMEYALLNGGKRLRPLLVYATGCIFDAPWENMDLPAAAIEMIHTYSLIHDDLPSMDNADLRRGKPACHKAHGEGIAVIAGDALNTLATQIIAAYPARLNAERRVQMLKVLSKAGGPYGMVGGQALDITLTNSSPVSIDLLESMFNLKTGALFSAAIELGRLASSDDDEMNQQALQTFGDYIGLAFQIQDDILDVETNTELLGKPQGIDVKNKKTTYPSLAGMAQAKAKVKYLHQEALNAINYMGSKAHLLRELCGYLLERKK